MSERMRFMEEYLLYEQAKNRLNYARHSVINYIRGHLAVVILEKSVYSSIDFMMYFLSSILFSKSMSI